MKYTIKQFQSQFPTDDSCIDYIFANKYSELNLEDWYRVTGRKCYANAQGEQIHPLAGTIFEKSSTPLTLWFYAIYLFSASRNGVSAKELERQLGVTYKTAWRMAKQIRALMGQDDDDKLSGDVEVDETYIGGRHKLEEGRSKKSVVMGMVERKGRVKAKKIDNRQSHIVLGQIKDNVAKGSQIMSDEYSVYKKTPFLGYQHAFVKHGKKRYAKGKVNTNSVEGFWSQLKRSIDGTYHVVSKKYLQSYLNEFAFRYNHRHSHLALFESLMSRI